MLPGLIFHLADFALQFGQELIAGLLTLLVRLGLLPDNFLLQLLEGDIGIHHHRFHVGQRFQVVVEVHGIEDTEDLFADILALASRPALHLLIENPALHRPQEHQVADFRHIDPSGQ